MSEPGSVSPLPAALPEDPQQAFADGVRDRAMPTAEATQLMAFLSRTQSARQACLLLAPSAESLRTQADPAPSHEPPSARRLADRSAAAEGLVQAHGLVTASSASFFGDAIKSGLVSTAVLLRAHGDALAAGASVDALDGLHLEPVGSPICAEAAAGGSTAGSLAAPFDASVD
ncbi:hypothetical protein HF319_12990 [Xanthomonas sp. Kuri4-1]